MKLSQIKSKTFGALKKAQEFSKAYVENNEFGKALAVKYANEFKEQNGSDTAWLSESEKIELLIPGTKDIDFALAGKNIAINAIVTEILSDEFKISVNLNKQEKIKDFEYLTNYLKAQVL